MALDQQQYRQDCQSCAQNPHPAALGCFCLCSDVPKVLKKSYAPPLKFELGSKGFQIVQKTY